MLDLNYFAPNVDFTRLEVPGRGKVRAGYFYGFETLVRKLGGNPKKILEHNGIDPLIFANPDNDIECISAVDMLEHASRELGDSLFGLRLADQQDPDALGCVIALARSAPSLRQSLQALIDYIPISASPECELEMVSTRKVVELRWRAPYGLSDGGQVNYHGVLLMMKTLKILGRRQFNPRYVSLALPVMRQDARMLEEYLGCKVNCKASASAIAFSSEALDIPISSANRTLYAILSTGLAHLRVVSKPTFIEQVESNVRRGVLEGCCALSDCAQKMGMSTRTLQKRLTSMDITYTDVVQKERIKLAQHSLRWSDSSLDEIALQLGYAEQTGFGRAFKRATGLTPKEFRAKT